MRFLDNVAIPVHKVSSNSYTSARPSPGRSYLLAGSASGSPGRGDLSLGLSDPLATTSKQLIARHA
jgi:hypothetical protein